MDKVAEEILQLITDRVNEHEVSVAEIESTLSGLKLWIRETVAKAVEDARDELRVTMHQLTAESIQTAKAKAQSAEKELAAIQDLLSVGGQMKSVRLIHDESGRTLGAIVTERTQ
jgi:hypothetical protein